MRKTLNPSGLRVFVKGFKKLHNRDVYIIYIHTHKCTYGMNADIWLKQTKPAQRYTVVCTLPPPRPSILQPIPRDNYGSRVLYVLSKTERAYTRILGHECVYPFSSLLYTDLHSVSTPGRYFLDTVV